MANEKDKYIQELEAALNAADDEKTQYMASNMSMFGAPSDENLIRWQLDLKEDMDRIYHLLKGHEIREDDKGNIEFVDPEDEDLKPFNEFGIKMIMNIMSFYLNRNTLLSNYDEETINWKVLDFGNDLADLIHNRYEQMMITIDVPKRIKDLTGKDATKLPNGKYVVDYRCEDGKITYSEIGESISKLIDTEVQQHLFQKIKFFPMIHRELVDAVHSAYLRALKGGERESLRTARTVTQSDPLGRSLLQAPAAKPSRFSITNPKTWV
jgi:hypothetical protein